MQISDPNPPISTGLWTPGITFDTPGDLAVAYSAQLGFWYRIGQLVFLHGGFTTSSFVWTTAAGTMRLTGLPFPVAVKTIDFNGPVILSGYTRAASEWLTARFLNGASTGYIQSSQSGGAIASLVAADFPSAGSVALRLSGQYEAA